MKLNNLLVFFLSKIYIVIINIISYLTKTQIKNIPIVINNRNRLEFLSMLLNFLEKKGFQNIIIIDNKSSYMPLIDFYKTLPYRVILLDENLGYKSLEQLSLYKEIRKNYFVYTDSDVVPIEDCPDDFMEYFLKQLKNNFWVSKVGFSLKIDDLPNHYDKKRQVIEWESQYFQNKMGEDYKAPIDTTFALHKPYALISTRGFFNMIRTGYPYQARHMPWYNNSKSLSEEEQFYIDHVEIGTHWSKGLDLKGKNFLERLFVKLKY